MRIMLVGCLTKNKSGNVYGGAEKSIINLANWLADRGHEVILSSVEGNVKAYPVSDKVTFDGYEIKTENKISVHLQMLRNTNNTIRKYNPEIVVGFWIHPLFYGIISGALRNIPFIYSERNDPNLDYGRISKYMRKIIVKKACEVIFQTQDAKQYFNDILSEKGVVIHNPVYLSKECYGLYDDNDNRIVTVGRLNHQKNHKLLIDAFHKFNKTNPKYKLEIYGDGPLRDELEAQIIRLNMSQKVFLMGSCSDVLDRIHGASLFVLPSIYEGMPNALLEAMCLGIPVISSDCPCGGPREIIQDGINGFLFSNNCEEELVSTMNKVVCMSNLDDIKMNAKEICVTHSRDEIFSVWERIIRRNVK